jgi:predicted nucleic acid-binding Zn ribbon protein
MTRKIGLGSTQMLRPVVMVSCAISVLLAQAAGADFVDVTTRHETGDTNGVIQRFRDASITSQTDGAFRIRLTDLSMPIGLEGSGFSVKDNLIEAVASANSSARSITVQMLASAHSVQPAFAYASAVSLAGGRLEVEVQAEHALFSVQQVQASTPEHQISALARIQADFSQLDISTPTELLGSRLSIDGNRIFGLASANSAEAVLSLESDTVLNADATILSVQENLGTGSHGNAPAGMTVVGRANADFRTHVEGQGNLIIGNVKDSQLSIDTNTVFAQAAVNRADNRIFAAGTRIQGSPGRKSGVSLSGVERSAFASTQRAKADLALLNTQNQSGQVEAVSSLTAQLDIRSANDGGGLLADSSMSLVDALMRSDAMANTAINQIIVESLTGVEAASASLGNHQQNDGRVSAQSNVSGIGTDADRQLWAIDSLRLSVQGIARSRARIEDTVFLASGSGNRATNLIRMSGAELHFGKDAAATVKAYADPMAPSLSSSEIDADVTLGSLQISEGRAHVHSAAALHARIEVGTGSISDSSLSLSENFVQSFSTDNEATNLVALSAKNAVFGAVGLSNMQLADGTAVQADAHLDLVATQMPGNDLSNSRVAFDGNVALSAASGNDAENLISISGAKIEGQSRAPMPLVLNAPEQQLASADFLLSNVQQRSGDAPIQARATLSAASLLTAPSIHDGSNFSISANAVEALSVSNRARNTIRLGADIVTETSAVISSAQTSDAPVEAVVSLDQLLGNLDLDLAEQLTVIISDNLAIAQAYGNDAINIFDIRATVTAPEEEIAVNTTGALNSTGSFAVDNIQRNTGNVTAQASALTDTADVTPSAGGVLNNSQIVLRNVGLATDASGNRSVTQIMMRGSSGSTAVTMSATTTQINTGSVTSTARARKFNNAPAGQIGNRPASSSGNPVTAIATGNSSITQLQRH